MEKEEIVKLIDSRQNALEELIRDMYVNFGEIIGILESINYLNFLLNKVEK